MSREMSVVVREDQHMQVDAHTDKNYRKIWRKIQKTVSSKKTTISLLNYCLCNGFCVLVLSLFLTCVTPIVIDKIDK